MDACPNVRLTLLFLFLLVVFQGACFRENCRYAHDAADGTVVPAQVRGFIEMRARVCGAEDARVTGKRSLPRRALEPQRTDAFDGSSGD